MSKARPILPAIMSGGAGTRLWPLSRAARPKQFQTLGADTTLFAETLARVRAGPDLDALPPLVIGGAAHGALIRDAALAAGAELSAIILEPCARNTAAVAAVAAAWAERHAPDALVLLAPADHRIADPAGFRAALAAAAPGAADAIVVFGIRPDRPHTGFGYIECGRALAPGLFDVAGFREKPDATTAEAYLKGGRHFWNAGLFLFSPQTMRAELQAFAPAIAQAAEAALAHAQARDGALLLDEAAFAAAPSDSLDYAVMEKTAQARVAGPLDIGWSDVGSWSAIAPGDHGGVSIDCAGNLLVSDGPFIAALGVDDLVIVATSDAVLVAPRARAEEVKKIVAELSARGRRDLL